MLQRISVIALVALVLGCKAGASPADIVRKAYSVEKSAVYAGKLTNTVQISGRTLNSTVNIYRSALKLRMEYTSGPMNGVVVIEDGQAVYRLDKSAKTVYVSLPPPVTSNVKLLLANYIPVAAGKESIAGQAAEVIKLQPKKTGNPRIVLWVDSKTGVILRSERYLHTGILATRSTYNSINYKSASSRSLYSIPGEWKKVDAGATGHPLSIVQVQKSAGFKPLQPSYIPGGYVFGGYFLRQTGSGKIAVVIKYTDGLNSITVFQRECGSGRGRGRGMGYGRRLQAGNKGQGKNRCLTRSEPFGLVAEAQVNTIIVTVTADISKPQLQKIANSF